MRIGILGGSVISRIGLEKDEKDLIQLIEEFNPKLKRKYKVSQGGLTFSQAIRILNELENCDFLILYFGTSVAWPVPSRRVLNFFRKELIAPKQFHFPPKKSKSASRRLKGFLRRKIFLIIKFCLFPFGLYGPKNSFEDLPDLVKATAELAKKKGKHVIWIQHRSLGFLRLWYERRVNEKYFKEIISLLKPYKSRTFRVIYPKAYFMKRENYLLDCIHLSGEGHKQMAIEVTRVLKEMKRGK